jgi:hypothetical protein
MHKIENTDKHEAKKMAWHGLTAIREDLSLDRNWLRDWDLIERPLYDESSNPVGYSILGCTDDSQIRIGKPFNPETYKPIDNEAFLDLVYDCIAGTDHELESVGSVRNRGRVFCSIKLKGLEDYATGGRQFRPYLNFGNGHDKSSVLWVNTSNVCTVCDNTFKFNLDAKNTGVSFKLRHTKNAMARFPDIAKLVDKAIGVHAEFQIAFDRLSEMEVKPVTAKRWIAGFEAETLDEVSTRKLNRIDCIDDLFRNGKGNNGNDRSDLLSAVTDFYTHEIAKTSSLGNRIYNSEMGKGADRKTDAMSNLLDHGRFEETVTLGKLVMN